MLIVCPRCWAYCIVRMLTFLVVDSGFEVCESSSLPFCSGSLAWRSKHAIALWQRVLLLSCRFVTFLGGLIHSARELVQYLVNKFLFCHVGMMWGRIPGTHRTRRTHIQILSHTNLIAVRYYQSASFQHCDSPKPHTGTTVPHSSADTKGFQPKRHQPLDVSGRTPEGRKALA